VVGIPPEIADDCTFEDNIEEYTSPSKASNVRSHPAKLRFVTSEEYEDFIAEAIADPINTVADLSTVSTISFDG